MFTPEDAEQDPPAANLDGIVGLAEYELGLGKILAGQNERPLPAIDRDQARQIGLVAAYNLTDGSLGIVDRIKQEVYELLDEQPATKTAGSVPGAKKASRSPRAAKLKTRKANKAVTTSDELDPRTVDDLRNFINRHESSFPTPLGRKAAVLALDIASRKGATGIEKEVMDALTKAGVLGMRPREARPIVYEAVRLAISLRVLDVVTP